MRVTSQRPSEVFLTGMQLDARLPIHRLVKQPVATLIRRERSGVVSDLAIVHLGRLN